MPLTVDSQCSHCISVVRMNPKGAWRRCLEWAGLPVQHLFMKCVHFGTGSSQSLFHWFARCRGALLGLIELDEQVSLSDPRPDGNEYYQATRGMGLYPTVPQSAAAARTGGWWRTRSRTRPPSGSSEATNCARNTPQLTSIRAWFYKCVAGITPAAPGFRRVSVSPAGGQGPNATRAAIGTPVGVVAVAWALLLAGAVALNGTFVTPCSRVAKGNHETCKHQPHC
mmetsp:Transcript_30856/g.52120  ORF Transcript_30856/g.52120 Transcript_30856/m.52120 type:complete len:225 (+) Transcript_30856:101-775(+)